QVKQVDLFHQELDRALELGGERRGVVDVDRFGGRRQDRSETLEPAAQPARGLSGWAVAWRGAVVQADLARWAEAGARPTEDVRETISRAIEQQPAEGGGLEDRAEPQRAAQVAQILLHFGPLAGAGNLPEHAQPIGPFTRSPAAGLGPDVSRAQH